MSRNSSSSRPEAAAQRPKKGGKLSFHKWGHHAVQAPNAPEHKTQILPRFIIKHNLIVLMTHMLHKKEGAKKCDLVAHPRRLIAIIITVVSHVMLVNLVTTNHSQVSSHIILRRYCVRCFRNEPPPPAISEY